jgi:hypothetical protein
MDAAFNQQPSGDQLDADLDYTTGIRKRYINTLVAKGDTLLDDPEKFGMLNDLLTGLDKSSLSRKKIKVDSATAQTNAQAAAIIAQLLSGHDVTLIGNGPAARDPAIIAELPHRTDDIEMVPGELDQGVIPIEYNVFVADAQSQGLMKKD